MEPHNAIARILNGNGETEGTGFFVGPEGLIVTCAHVVEAGHGPGAAVKNDSVKVCLHGFEQAWLLGQRSARVEEGRQEYTARIVEISASDALDIAVMRLEVTSETWEMLTQANPEGRLEWFSIGSSDGAEKREFQTFGFSEVKKNEGIAGLCKIIGRAPESSTSAYVFRSNEVSHGFSGGAIWDDLNTAVGMVVSIIGMVPDPDGGRPAPWIPITSRQTRAI